MGTRSHIVYEDKEGNYHYRYHHSDGYIAGLGKTLQQHFKNEENICKLMEINRDFSTINYTIEDMEKLKRGPYADSYKDQHKHYHIETVGKNFIQCLKDSQPEEVKTQIVTTFEEVENVCNEEYIYVFQQKTKKWIVNDHGSPFIPLAQALKIDTAVLLADRILENKYETPEKLQKATEELRLRSYRIMNLYHTTQHKEGFDVFLKLTGAYPEPKIFPVIEQSAKEYKTLLLAEHLQNTLTERNSETEKKRFRL